MTETAVEISDLHLSLPSKAGRVDILHGVDLSIAAGGSTGIVGPSGSGKSSLLMVMGGLERATSGSVRVLGREITGLDEDALARFRRNNMGVVFQSFHLIPTMTALENVAAPLELAGRTDADEAARAELDGLGLGHRLDHYPAQLSGGEQQRVALARAVVVRPKVLLADEPTGNLDETTGARITGALFDLSEKYGATLVIVTHERALAERCDRVVAMRDGRIEEAARPAAAE
jgi:putative ABC transport system ATP-binding protein